MPYWILIIFTDDEKIHRFFYNMPVEGVIKDKNFEFCRHRSHFYKEAITKATSNGSNTTGIELEVASIEYIKNADDHYIEIDPLK